MGLKSHSIWLRKAEMQRQRGFTLIELMIVIAIIAILATLGVTNFASALRRARDAQRESDIVAVQKALETCNNITRGEYIANPADFANVSGVNAGDVVQTTGATEVGFAGIVAVMQAKGCLNEEIAPRMANYEYVGYVVADSPQRFLLCAELENWSGNYAQEAGPAEGTYNSGPVGIGDGITLSEDYVIGGVAGQCSDTNTACNLFCAMSSQ